MGKYRDITGQRFTRLTAVYDIGTKGLKKGEHFWHCICDCGAEIDVRVSSLLSDNTQSCGCYGKEQRKKATQAAFSKYTVSTKHALYIKWKHILSRCTNSKDPAYRYYGGRGITVCDEWRHDFQVFYNWCITSGWKKGITLDRIDNDGPYAPWNCRWITQGAQNKNKRSNKIIEYKGISMIESDWATLLGLNPGTISWRLKQGWPIEQALFWKSHQRHSQEELDELQSQKRK